MHTKYYDLPLVQGSVLLDGVADMLFCVMGIWLVQEYLRSHSDDILKIEITSVNVAVATQN